MITLYVQFSSRVHSRFEYEKNSVFGQNPTNQRGTVRVHVHCREVRLRVQATYFGFIVIARRLVQSLRFGPLRTYSYVEKSLFWLRLAVDERSEDGGCKNLPNEERSRIMNNKWGSQSDGMYFDVYSRKGLFLAPARFFSGLSPFQQELFPNPKQRCPKKQRILVYINDKTAPTW